MESGFYTALLFLKVGKMVVPYGIELYKYASDEGIAYLLGNSFSKE